MLMEGKHNAHRDILEEYQIKAEHYLCACLNRDPTNVRRTPGGVLYVRKWNNIQYATNAGFLLTVYADRLLSTNHSLRYSADSVGSQELLDAAKSQVDYILGDNSMAVSYLVGYGSRYPTRVHHRGASIESYKSNEGFIGCTQGYDSWYGMVRANPNVLVAALVGEPNFNNRFKDDRKNYMQTEACTYNKATLVGVLARLSGVGHDEGDNDDPHHSKSLVASM